MTIVKFDKSVKYQGVRYAAHQAFKVADEDVAELTKSGATVLATEPATPPVQQEGTADEKGKDVVDDQKQEDVAELKEQLLEYTVSELTKFAEAGDIDLQGKTRKADIYNIIVANLD